VDPKHLHTLARVSVARSIRLDAIPSAAGSAPELAEERGADVMCGRCGRMVCAAARRALFAGMVLNCACGEKNRVEKAA
jgi:hypothetical protein